MEYGWGRHALADSESGSVMSSRKRMFSSGGQTIMEWKPPQQPQYPSQLDEEAQLEGLRKYAGRLNREMEEHVSVEKYLVRPAPLVSVLCQIETDPSFSPTDPCTASQRASRARELPAQAQVPARGAVQVPDVHRCAGGRSAPSRESKLLHLRPQVFSLTLGCDRSLYRYPNGVKFALTRRWKRLAGGRRVAMTEVPYPPNFCIFLLSTLFWASLSGCIFYYVMDSSFAHTLLRSLRFCK